MLASDHTPNLFCISLFMAGNLQHCTSQYAQNKQVQSLDRLFISGGHGQFNCDLLPVFCVCVCVCVCVWEATVSSNVHSLTCPSSISSADHGITHPHRFPEVSLERLSWPIICLNNASFHLLTVDRRGSCGPIWKLILLCTHSLVLSSLHISKANKTLVSCMF